MYRAPSPQVAGVASLYLDDKYHVALQPNAFSLVCVEHDKVDLRTRLTLPEADLSPTSEVRHSQPLKKGGTHFVRISSQADGRPLLEPVPTRIATDELQNALQQMHTLSRAAVVRPCKPVKEFMTASAAVATELNVITFGADASFRNKKVDLNAITPNGKAALGQIVEKINNKYASAAQIKVHLIGYADDTGDEPVNKRLSFERAQTIQNYLLQNGLRIQELSLEGRGSEEFNRPANLTLSKKRVEVEVTVTMN